MLRCLTLLIALCLPSASPARTFVFDFTSGPSYAVSSHAAIDAPWFLGQPINARIVLDTPSIANLSYSATFAHGSLLSQTASYLVGAKLMGISFRDIANLMGGISITTNSRGRLTAIDFTILRDTPDVSASLHRATWGDSARTLYAANGSWTLSEDPAPIPLPATAPLLAAAALSLGGLRFGIQRRRRKSASRSSPSATSDVAAA